MKTVKVETTDGYSVEINPNAISEIVELEKEDIGFLGIFGGHEAKYQINMIDGKNYEIREGEHNKLQREIS